MKRSKSQCRQRAEESSRKPQEGVPVEQQQSPAASASISVKTSRKTNRQSHHLVVSSGTAAVAPPSRPKKRRLNHHQQPTAPTPKTTLETTREALTVTPIVRSSNETQQYAAPQQGNNNLSVSLLIPEQVTRSELPRPALSSTNTTDVTSRTATATPPNPYDEIWLIRSVVERYQEATCGVCAPRNNNSSSCNGEFVCSASSCSLEEYRKLGGKKIGVSNQSQEANGMRQRPPGHDFVARKESSAAPSAMIDDNINNRSLEGFREDKEKKIGASSQSHEANSMRQQPPNHNAVAGKEISAAPGAMIDDNSNQRKKQQQQKQPQQGKEQQQISPAKKQSKERCRKGKARKRIFSTHKKKSVNRKGSAALSAVAAVSPHCLDYDDTDNKSRGMQETPMTTRSKGENHETIEENQVVNSIEKTDNKLENDGDNYNAEKGGDDEIHDKEEEDFDYHYDETDDDDDYVESDNPNDDPDDDDMAIVDDLTTNNKDENYDSNEESVNIDKAPPMKAKRKKRRNGSTTAVRRRRSQRLQEVSVLLPQQDEGGTSENSTTEPTTTKATTTVTTTRSERWKRRNQVAQHNKQVSSASVTEKQETVLLKKKSSIRKRKASNEAQTESSLEINLEDEGKPEQSPDHNETFSESAEQQFTSTIEQERISRENDTEALNGRIADDFLKASGIATVTKCLQAHSILATGIVGPKIDEIEGTKTCCPQDSTKSPNRKDEKCRTLTIKVCGKRLKPVLPLPLLADQFTSVTAKISKDTELTIADSFQSVDTPELTLGEELKIHDEKHDGSKMKQQEGIEQSASNQNEYVAKAAATPRTVEELVTSKCLHDSFSPCLVEGEKCASLKIRVCGHVLKEKLPIPALADPYKYTAQSKQQAEILAVKSLSSCNMNESATVEVFRTQNDELRTKKEEEPNQCTNNQNEAVAAPAPVKHEMIEEVVTSKCLHDSYNPRLLKNEKCAYLKIKICGKFLKEKLPIPALLDQHQHVRQSCRGSEIPTQDSLSSDNNKVLSASMSLDLTKISSNETLHVDTGPARVGQVFSNCQEVAVDSKLSPGVIEMLHKDSVHDSAPHSVELGYIVLKSCEGVLVDGSSVSTTRPVLPYNQWIDVSLSYANTETNGECSQTRHCDCPCFMCNINLTTVGANLTSPSEKSRQLELRLNEVPLFDGLESTIFHADCHRPRSDASLLFGLLRSCYGWVTIRSCAVVFHESQDECGTVSIAITLGFPLLMKGIPGQRFLLAATRPKSNKCLSPSLQLLLSTIRSDWRNLDLLMDSLEKPLNRDFNLKHSLRLPFFPSHLWSEELYSRIPGSSGPQRLVRIETCQAILNESQLLQLPREVLLERIAPFLKAKSLNSLRCSCSYLHSMLRAVIPGMKLKLYSHQITSMCWMRGRECRGLLESDCLGLSLSREASDQHACDTDLNRAVTGGKTVLLQPRPRQHTYDVNLSTSTDAIRIDQYTGREVVDSQLKFSRKVARGGLLCDDPGLGKTITVLSLILQTSGLQTTKQDSVPEEKVSDDDIFNSYWKDQITKEFRVPILNKILNGLARHDEGTGLFPVKAIWKSIQEDQYWSDFSAFVDDVREAVLQYSPDDDEKSAALRLESHFHELVATMKKTQMRAAKRSFSNAVARPNSEVAAIIQKQFESRINDALIRSGGTLVVIPAVLMEHWQSQIEMHVDMKYITDKEPLIFVFGKKENQEMTVETASILCNVKKTHSPVVFLDMGGTRTLPPAEFLAQFHVVITTTQRFQNEFENGSFRQELEASGDDEEMKKVNYELSEEYRNSNEACPLLKVSWLRMVVDEGHSMGGSRYNSAVQFASWIWAERRWAMTGTPTKHTGTLLNQLLALLDFLRHEFFTQRCNGDRAWKDCIARGWRDGYLASFFRLRSLLGLLMKRHTKLDIVELEPPLVSMKLVPLSFMESKAYNTLVCGVKSNILITSMKGKTSGAQDSLLHKSQTRHARGALTNIQGVCIGWSRVVPSLSLDNFNETLVRLQGHGIEEKRVEIVRKYMMDAQGEQLFPCMVCGIQISTLLLMPCCAGLICPECMEEKPAECLVCEHVFDVDDFQLLQAGFALAWKSNLEEDRIKSERIAARAAQAEQEAPAAVLGYGNPQAGPQLIRGQPIVPSGRRRAKPGDGHKCVYDQTKADGRCGLCLLEHHNCNLMNAKGRCNICFRVSLDCPEDESKAAYLTETLINLYGKRKCFLSTAQTGRDPGAPKKDTRPLKAIVFSQFRKALNFVGDRLLQKFGTACVAEYWGRYRTAELHKFTHEKECFCMLLSKDGSEGLDLSFVTHIFFLEQIWDQSLVDQAIARAWRMGALGRVEVETLIAKNSIEEIMREMEAAADKRKRGEYEETDAIEEAESTDGMKENEQQRAKTHYLLKSLKLLTDHNQFCASKVTRTIHNMDIDLGNRTSSSSPSSVDADLGVNDANIQSTTQISKRSVVPSVAEDADTASVRRPKRVRFA